MEYFGMSLWTIFFIALALDIVVAAIVGIITKEWKAFLGVAAVGLILVMFAMIIAAIAVQSHNSTAFDAGVVEKYNVLVIQGATDVPPAGNTVKDIQVVKDRLYLNCNAIVGAKPLDSRLFCGTLEELAK